MGRSSRSVNTRAMLRASTASPTCVPVAWHSTRDTVLGREPGRRVGQPHGPFLAFLGGCQQAAAAPVVGQADALDHAVDPRAGGDRVRQPHERHERRALGRHQPVRVLVEGPAAPLRLSADSALKPVWMNRSSEQVTAPATITSAVRSCSRSQASFTAYSDDAHEASSANAPRPRPSAVAAKCAGKPEQNRLRPSGLGSPGDRAERRPHRRWLRVQPHPLGEPGHRGAREPQVPDHQAAALHRAVLAVFPERGPGAVQHPQEQGVEPGDLGGIHGEPGRVEHGVEAAHVAADVVPASGPRDRPRRRAPSGAAAATGPPEPWTGSPGRPGRCPRTCRGPARPAGRSPVPRSRSARIPW